uniref:Alpha-2B adrenergic receptor n=1 Tax=Esox lucius TaxID=8010 RepID=A0A3P8ZJM5_ESOLU
IASFAIAKFLIAVIRSGVNGVTNLNLSVSSGPAHNNQTVRTPPYSPEATALFATAITLMMILTIVGNILVIIAVLTSRSLRSPQNLFLVSLAAADILVATLIIPFSLANELQGFWAFRSLWCEIYLALDVFFCTSSIAHLCAISLDRYLSVSRPVSYGAQRTPARIKAAIVVVWLLSAVISFPPLLPLDKSKGGEEVCELNSEPWYILYSTIGSFFAPCLIMIGVYVRIYQIAKQHTRCPPGEKPNPNNSPGSVPSNPVAHAPGPVITPQPMPPSQLQHNTREGGKADGQLKNAVPQKSLLVTSPSRSAGERSRETPPMMTATATAMSRRKAMVNREKRFTFVLAVVIGVFVICWFPFFLSYSLKAICPETCTIPKPLFKFFFWIGYCNSCLNPVIYTIFNQDFRKAFKKILCRDTKGTFF